MKQHILFRAGRCGRAIRGRLVTYAGELCGAFERTGSERIYWPVNGGNAV